MLVQVDDASDLSFDNLILARGILQEVWKPSLGRDLM